MPTLPSAWLGLISAGSAIGPVEIRAGCEIGLARHRDALRFGHQAHDLLVVADRHAGRRGAAIGHALQLEQGRDVELLGRDVAKAGVAEIQHQGRRIGGKARRQPGVVVEKLELEAAQPLQRRAHRRVGRLILLVVALAALGEIGQPRIAGEDTELQHASPTQTRAQARKLRSFRTDRRLARTAGLEPATSCSGGKRSIQLSYARVALL